MHTITQIRERFQAIIVQAESSLHNHHHLIERLKLALAFGNVQGFPGWTEVVESWLPKLEQAATSFEEVTSKALGRSVSAYAQALLDPTAIGLASAYLDALEDLLPLKDKPGIPAINIASPTPLQSLRNHFENCNGASQFPSLQWYIGWLADGLELCSKLETENDPIYAESLLSEMLAPCPLLVQFGGEAGDVMVRQRHAEAITLFVAFLRERGLDLIIPKPLQTKVNFSEPNVVNATGSAYDATIRQTVSPGLSLNGRALKKADVEVVEN